MSDTRVLGCPIEVDGEPVGFIGYVNDAAFRSRQRRASDRLAEVAAAAGIPALNALRHDEALRLAYKDSLTGIYNRRAFNDYLDREGQRAARHTRPLALILLDLDNLKQINDTYGHGAGDDALRALADVLSRTLRRVDIVARLGGDEFAVLCPETDAPSARRVASRIRRTFATRSVGEGAAAITLGVSCGVADLASGEYDVARMYELADVDLYRAKRARTEASREIAAPRSAARIN